MASKFTKNHSLLFSIPLLLVWCIVGIVIGTWLNGSPKEHQCFGNLLIVVSGAMGYFSSALVKFYKLVQYQQDTEDNNETEIEKIISPLEALYYPVALFLSTGLFIESFGLEQYGRLSFLIAIVASFSYLLVWIGVLWGSEIIIGYKIGSKLLNKEYREKLIKCLKEQSDT